MLNRSTIPSCLLKLVLLLAVLAYAEALKCYQGQQSSALPVNGTATECPMPAGSCITQEDYDTNLVIRSCQHGNCTFNGAPMSTAICQLTQLNVDNLISRLLNVGEQRLTVHVSENEVSQLCQMVRDVFMRQPMLMEVDAPLVICGDIHGQYADLLRIFSKSGFPTDTNYFFLGDYVDRGRQNIEAVCLLFCYKVKYSENFFMLRGNHECPMINRVYGFLDEIYRRYKNPRLWNTFQDAFAAMPLADIVGGRILCMHGGLSPELRSLDQLRSLRRVREPVQHTLAEDLLWSDPDPWVKGWQANTRGASYVCGADVVVDACRNLDIDLIARAHQVVQDGYEFFANRRLVTIFSAPHYCGNSTMLVPRWQSTKISAVPLTSSVLPEMFQECQSLISHMQHMHPFVLCIV